MAVEAHCVAVRYHLFVALGHITTSTTMRSFNSLFWLSFAASSVAADSLLYESQAPLVNVNYASDQEKLESYKETPVITLHRELVQIPSVSGNEADVGNFLISHLHSLGYTTERQNVGNASSSSSRFNVLAYRGHHRQTRTLFTSHIDTVPPFFNYSVRPPSAASSNGSPEIWGRGTNDDKSCVAAQIIALQDLWSSKKIKASDASLLFVVGEEVGGDGMQAANELGLDWETVIFGEPTEGKLAAGHKGFLALQLEAVGQAVHSGYPWLGRSANDILVAALAALHGLSKLEESRGGLPRSEKYGETTINLGRIEGGVAANVVAEKASALVAIRLAGGTPEQSKKIVLDAINDATAGYLEDGKGSLSVTFKGNPYAPVDCDTDIDGFDTITVNYGTDVPSLTGKHKRYLYGPGSILVAHSDHEHLTVAELEQSVEDYKKILLTVLEN